MTSRPSPPKKRWQPIDRIALVLIVILSLLIGGLSLSGDHTAPRVRDFSWGDRQVGAEDRAFLLTFSRPMDYESVERNLKIEPPLPGKISWAGRRMAYTLDVPAPYGTEFKLQLQGARDLFSKNDDGREMALYESTFQSRDRALLYLGVEGDRAGRLILNNLTRKEEVVLTPPDLVVMDYEPYPEGDRVLFSATERNSDDPFGLDQKVYTVTTGIHISAPAVGPGVGQGDRPNAKSSPQPAGVIELVMDNREYQNLKFDLAPNGEFVVAQRANRQNPSEFGLWIIRPGEEAERIETEPGGDFLVAPDSTSVAMAQGEGMAILPLQSGADPLDFLPKFGMVLSFASDGSAATMVKFNRVPQNPTESLFLVTSQGTEKDLLTTDGSILSAQFDPTKTWLYGLITKLVPGDQFIEQPILTAVNVKSGERIDLLKLPLQRDIQMSLAPDGLGVLFDQTVTVDDPNNKEALRGSDGAAIATSRLWFFPILKDNDGKPTAVEPQQLPLAGLRPQWLP